MENEKSQLLIEQIYKIAEKNNPYPYDDPQDNCVVHKRDVFNEGYVLGYTHGVNDSVKIGHVPEETVKQMTDATMKALDKAMITTDLIAQILHLSTHFDMESNQDQWSFGARCEYIQQHLND